MSHRLLYAALLALSLLPVACAQPQAALPERLVEVTSHVEVTEVARRVQAAITPWKRADVDHVELALYEMPARFKRASLTIAKADLDKAVRFNALHSYQSYMVEARAWADAAGVIEIDNLALDAASCTTTFQTTAEDRIDVGVLKLRLADKHFDGQATGAIAVTDGVVNDTTATPGIQLIMN